MQLFYNSEINEYDERFTFSKEESRHIVGVLRKKEGDVLQITNGQGLMLIGKIIASNVKKCAVEIISWSIEKRPKNSLHMAVAPTKMNDRFEWFLEKATEIGIQEITPIICERSERKVIKRERMAKVLSAAMKQSLRTYLPKLNEAIPYEEFLKTAMEGNRFIAHCEAGEKTTLRTRLTAGSNVTILIGPEGDFSPREITAAYEKGFSPVSLGNSRLRTETAAIVACTLVNMNDDT